MWDFQTMVIIEILTKIDGVMVVSKFLRGTILSFGHHLKVVVCTFIGDLLMKILVLEDLMEDIGV
jgi:hypothetical protein